MKEEWGPIITHDGTGCPVVGQMVRVILFNNEERVLIAGAECYKVGVSPSGEHSAWVWDKPTQFKKYCISHYQVRKPKGLTILEGILSSVPDKKDWHKLLPLELVQ